MSTFPVYVAASATQAFAGDIAARGRRYSGFHRGNALGLGRLKGMTIQIASSAVSMLIGSYTATRPATRTKEIASSSSVRSQGQQLHADGCQCYDI